MQILISGQQINLGDNFRIYAEGALDSSVSKYFDEAVSADVRVTREGSEIKTELTVHPKTGAVIRSSASSADAYASLDGAISRLSRQLRKYKNKLTEHKNIVEMADMSVIEAVNETEESVDAPVIIAEMQTQIPVCTVSEAVMRMDLEGLPALMFKNTAHGGLNMVYRRSDGNIGWVDPKQK
ncbi:MAG: ribosome-associated translation inhibitor RaiA [Alphaproteobacteria bacterium]|nr:ribosome-associated translation inhibitor RaiA [Alphaproteobacteria bacterium]